MSNPPKRPARLGTAQRGLIAVIVGLAAARIAYGIIAGIGAKETSIFFVGLPAILAIAVIASGKSRTASGSVFRSLTIGLLLAGVALGEGFVCIVMVAPLFYLIAVPFALLADRRRDRIGGSQLHVSILIPLVVVMLEGVAPFDTFPRDDHATATVVVAASVAEVEEALRTEPMFDRDLPTILRLARFPRPVAAYGEGLNIGDERDIVFVTAETSTHLGDEVIGPMLSLRVTRRGPQEVVFDVIGDDTAIADWTTLQRAVISWESVDATHTRVVWRLEWHRRLAPGFYFGPLQRHVATEAAEYLARTLTTP